MSPARESGEQCLLTRAIRRSTYRRGAFACACVEPDLFMRPAQSPKEGSRSCAQPCFCCVFSAHASVGAWTGSLNVRHCSYDEPSASGSNLLGSFQPDLVGSYLVTTRTADSAKLTIHGFNEAGAANATGGGFVTIYPNCTFLWRREFGINLLSGYSYDITVGSLLPAVLA